MGRQPAHPFDCAQGRLGAGHQLAGLNLDKPGPRGWTSITFALPTTHQGPITRAPVAHSILVDAFVIVEVSLRTPVHRRDHTRPQPRLPEIPRLLAAYVSPSFRVKPAKAATMPKLPIFGSLERNHATHGGRSEHKTSPARHNAPRSISESDSDSMSREMKW